MIKNIKLLGGEIHWCEGGRTYWNGMLLEFNNLNEAQFFLKNLQKKPRLTLELYLRTLLGNSFPETDYNVPVTRPSDYYRDWLYPFHENHGRINVFTKDLIQ